jgi:hypothetical protein
LRQAVVTDIRANRKIDVTLGGVALESVPCLTSAVPVVGSAVQLIVVGRDMFALGSVADATAHGYTPLIQHGNLVVANTGASTVQTVTFGWAFPAKPDVTVTCSRGHPSNKPYIATVRRDNLTAADVPIRVSSFDGSSNSEDVDVFWIAVQRGE